MALSYSSYTTVTISAWGSSLVDGDIATSALIDNTSNLYEDFLISGHLATGTGWAAGEGAMLYIASNINTGTVTDVAGAIGATGAIDANEEIVEGTDVLMANVHPLRYVEMSVASNTLHLPYMSVAAALGSYPPPSFYVIIELHASGTDPLSASGSELGYVGVKTTT